MANSKANTAKSTNWPGPPLQEEGTSNKETINTDQAGETLNSRRGLEDKIIIERVEDVGTTNKETINVDQAAETRNVNKNLARNLGQVVLKEQRFRKRKRSICIFSR